jgi:hypothetical protein
MKYAAIMIIGLIANITLFSIFIPSTEHYSGLMDSKQRLIQQLNKQVECIKLASSDQELQGCQTLQNPV